MERVGERVALTKSWVLDKLVENVEKAMTVKGGSSVANRALELIGKEIGMFVDREPVRQVALEDLSTEDLERMLGPADGADPGDKTHPQ
jgi:hypothetical protein